MPVFSVRRDVDAPAHAVWALITDWPSHGRWVPLTRVTVTRAVPDGVGTRFVGRTGVGPLAFDDPMEVVRWEPPDGDRPGTCTVRKLGRVVLGWAEVRVQPLRVDRCRVVWTEDLQVAPVRLTRWASPVVSLAGRLAFAALLRAMARDAARA